jgi:hypothetical protein
MCPLCFDSQRRNLEPPLRGAKLTGALPNPSGGEGERDMIFDFVFCFVGPFYYTIFALFCNMTKQLALRVPDPSQGH